MLNRIFTVDSVTLASTGTAVSTYVPYDQTTRKLPTQVVVKATGQGAYVRLSDDNSAATNADVLVQAGDHVVLSVQGRHWVSVLSDGASSTVNIGALSTGVWGDASTLNLNFVAGTLDSRITFTRASSATYFDSNGTLQSVGNDVPRFDYDPSTLAAQGLLIEEQRTNSVANNTMVGVVAGTPGTAPTGWSVGPSANGLTRTVVGTGVENGIAYLDIRYAGTTTAAANIAIIPSSTTSTAALQGQTWAGSVYVSVVGGSTAGWTNFTMSLVERDSGGALLANTSTPFTPTSAALATQRVQNSRTLASASTAFVTGAQLSLNYPNGANLDITLRIGLPQLENNNISTGVSTATVQAGGTGYTNGDTLTVVGGTGTAATLTVTGVSAGVITTVSVATAGSYSVFPISPVSVTGGTGTLATFNLTPVAQTGFATSVIQTSGAAATRSADQAQINTLSPWFNATEGTLVAETPAVSGVGGGANTTRIAVFSDGTNSNRIIFYTRQITAVSGGVSSGGTTGTGTGLDAGKRGWAYKFNDAAYVKDGGTVQTDSSFTVPVTMSQLVLGSNSPFTATTNLNGCISRLTYYPRRLSNTELQTVTS